MSYFVDSFLSAASLAMDALAVSLCVGARGRGGMCRAALRMSAACGAFQFFLPLGGWLLGVYALGLISSVDHWVAFGLLAFVGGDMIRSSFRGEKGEPCQSQDPSAKLSSLLLLALATSIDALAVGASFALAGRGVFFLALSAGLVTAALCCVGVLFGSRAGPKLGSRAEMLGGVVLIAIGLNILRAHML